jgi:hypothetical protein
MYRTWGRVYHEGPVRVSLVDARSGRLINTVAVRTDYEDTFRLPTCIRKGLYHIEGVSGEEEGTPTIIWLKDYNGDGEPLEFALFDQQSAMTCATSLFGYSTRQDRVVQYQIQLSGPSGMTTVCWLDGLFAEKPVEPGHWEYQIDYRGRGGNLDKYSVRYGPQEFFRAELVSTSSDDMATNIGQGDQMGSSPSSSGYSDDERSGHPASEAQEGYSGPEGSSTGSSSGGRSNKHRSKYTETRRYPIDVWGEAGDLEVRVSAEIILDSLVYQNCSPDYYLIVRSMSLRNWGRYKLNLEELRTGCCHLSLASGQIPNTPPQPEFFVRQGVMQMLARHGIGMKDIDPGRNAVLATGNSVRLAVVYSLGGGAVRDEEVNFKFPAVEVLPDGEAEDRGGTTYFIGGRVTK